MRKKVLVFASGDQNGGGSGFQEMVERSRTKPAILKADIVGVVSNYPAGGVYQKAQALNIPFKCFPGPFTAEEYDEIIEQFQPDYIMCSGWLKPMRGQEEGKVINIHPGPLPHFGGPGLYGHHVHEAVIAAFKRGEITQSAVSIHFVNEEYDRGPGIVQIPVLIRPDDTAETLAARVLKVEHNYQSIVLNEIIHGRIFITGTNRAFIRNKELRRLAFSNK